MIKAVTEDGHFRAVIVKATDIVESARVRHNLNILTASILGELLMGSLIASSSLKGEERLTLRVDTDGPVKVVVAEATSTGEVRGYIQNPDVVPECESIQESKEKAIGKGILKIVQVLYAQANPVTSIIEIVESSIVKDLTRYYAISEQIPTAIKMDIKFNDDFSIKEAIGIMVQAMPGASEEDIIDLEINIIDAANLAKMVSDGLYIDEILRNVLRNHKIREVSRTPVDFFCRCSKEKFIESMRLLGPEDIKSLHEEEELVCHYCNAHYTITKKEVLKDLV
jgi:molecular chaperone Hsp33